MNFYAILWGLTAEKVASSLQFFQRRKLFVSLPQCNHQTSFHKEEESTYATIRNALWIYHSLGRINCEFTFICRRHSTVSLFKSSAHWFCNFSQALSVWTTSCIHRSIFEFLLSQESIYSCCFFCCQKQISFD